MKTLVKNQSAAAINSMSQSMNRVNSRMNFIRPMQNNSFNQNIELAMNLNDPFADRIFDALAIKYLKPKKETKKFTTISGRIALDNEIPADLSALNSCFSAKPPKVIIEESKIVSGRTNGINLGE